MIMFFKIYNEYFRLIQYLLIGKRKIKNPQIYIYGEKKMWRAKYFFEPIYTLHAGWLYFASNLTHLMQKQWENFDTISVMEFT